MPYDSSKLAVWQADPSDADGALAWVRLRASDKDDFFVDAEWQAELLADAVTIDGTLYFRPHETAARVIASDAARPLAESTLKASITREGALTLASRIRKENRWMDDLIQETIGDAFSLEDYLKPSNKLLARL